MSLFDADEFLVVPEQPPLVDPPPEDAVDEVADDPSDVVVEPIGMPGSLDDPDAAPDDVTIPEPEPEPQPEWAPSVDTLWADVVMQPDAVKALRAAGRAPVHAYLLVGAAGSGTREASRAFAASLLCPRGGCRNCEVCVRALAEAHPDLVVVEREGASISVDQAREIIRLAMRSPIEGARKVLVLVDFHLVTNAAPTLLKIIEEPPASTIFVILAEHLPSELVTIASRCVQVPFRRLTHDEVVQALVADGADPGVADRCAKVAAGRLDRARLLVSDAHLGQRLSFWEQAGRRLDGTGAAAAVLAAEAVALLDDAAVKPLEERQRQEAAAFEERLEASGARGGAGQRKELTDRHKRELKRLRDDELRVGLGLLQRSYRDALVAGSIDGSAGVAAVGVLAEANEQLERNPNVLLMLQAIFLRLPHLR